MLKKCFWALSVLACMSFAAGGCAQVRALPAAVYAGEVQAAAEGELSATCASEVQAAAEGELLAPGCKAAYVCDWRSGTPV